MKTSEGNDVPYYHSMQACRQGKHEQCEGRREPTSHIDSRATVCRCCDNNHFEGETKVRHTEWKITRNWLRSGDPCRVKGIRGECKFVALVTNGEEHVEVSDGAGRIRTAHPANVRRVSKRGGR